ncbi:MAG: DciA family protein [Pseudomonadota bacterium]
MESRIRRAGESRGFAVSRLLTHWEEIVGADLAKQALPVNVTYARASMGATLTILTTASQAPILQMQVPQIREKVNACYGYAAIARIRITQSSPKGLAGQGFVEKPAPFTPSAPDPAAAREAEKLAQGVENEELRQALTQLGGNIMNSSKRTR